MRARADRLLLTSVLACSPSSEHETDVDPRSDVLAGTAAAPAPAGDADVDATLSALQGTRRHAGGQAERDALERAIDAAVADMSFFTRGTARKRLREANPVPDVLRIEGDESRLTVAFEDRKYTAAVGGPEVEVVGITGDTLKMILRVREGALVQRFVGPKGIRTNTFTLENGRLRMKAVVESKSLPKPLTYALTFE